MSIPDQDLEMKAPADQDRWAEQPCKNYPDYNQCLLCKCEKTYLRMHSSMKISRPCPTNSKPKTLHIALVKLALYFPAPSFSSSAFHSLRQTTPSNKGKLRNHLRYYSLLQPEPQLLRTVARQHPVEIRQLEQPLVAELQKRMQPPPRRKKTISKTNAMKRKTTKTHQKNKTDKKLALALGLSCCKTLLLESIENHLPSQKTNRKPSDDRTIEFTWPNCTRGRLFWALKM